MKKSIVAATVASAAVAVLPMAGVFATATEAGTITDTLTVNIPAACTITNNNSPASSDGSNPALTNTYYVTMHNNQLKSDIGGSGNTQSGATLADNTIDVTCNTPSGDSTDASGWKLTAVGDGEGTNKNTLHGTAGDIATGTGTAGNISQWAFKVVKADNVQGVEYATGYDGSFAAVPAASSPMDVVTGHGNATSAFTITYQVYISKTQATGEYTGAVKYTLYNPAS